MYRYAAEWFWDNVDCEKIISWAELNANNVPDDIDLDEMLGDWAYESEYERDGNYVEVFHNDQEKVVWSGDTAADSLEKWLGTSLYLTEEIINKCAKVVMYRFAAEWFWDNVDCEKIISWAELNANNVPDDIDLDEMLGDWAYESEWIYEEDCSSDYHTWDHGKLEINNPNVTDEMYREMAKSFREYYDRNK